MHLTLSQFDQALRDNRLALSFIGMSNTGKTFWAKRLEKIGFRRWSCDDEIERRLGNELKALGYQGIEDVAEWMGLPQEERSTGNQQKYLAHETDSMRDILSEINPPKARFHNRAFRGLWVIDTTGSFIYTDPDVITKVQENTLIVWIQATAEMKDLLFKQFLEHPKPVIWGDQYQPLSGETPEAALRRCYPKLLEYRTARYAKIADVAIPYEHLPKETTGSEILERIRKNL
ncbi:hypothetical protein HZA43_03210 [Candidatus Peregrinibacteria bacterium]|nr:hypothetical protein [Candidatus Peregrinibacteria bacterium]